MRVRTAAKDGNETERSRKRWTHATGSRAGGASVIERCHAAEIRCRQVLPR